MENPAAPVSQGTPSEVVSPMPISPQSESKDNFDKAQGDWAQRYASLTKQQQRMAAEQQAFRAEQAKFKTQQEAYQRYEESREIGRAHV